MSRVKRVILGGNNIVDLSVKNDFANIDDVVKGSFRAEINNQWVYSKVSESLDYFEQFIHTLSQTVDVTIMPA